MWGIPRHSGAPSAALINCARLRLGRIAMADARLPHSRPAPRSSGFAIAVRPRRGSAGGSELRRAFRARLAPRCAAAPRRSPCRSRGPDIQLRVEEAPMRALSSHAEQSAPGPTSPTLRETRGLRVITSSGSAPATIAPAPALSQPSKPEVSHAVAAEDGSAETSTGQWLKEHMRFSTSASIIPIHCFRGVPGRFRYDTPAQPTFALQRTKCKIYK
jgi:hypothetical protein